MGVRTIGENPYRIGNPIRAVSIQDLELSFRPSHRHRRDRRAVRRHVRACLERCGRRRLVQSTGAAGSVSIGAKWRCCGPMRVHEADAIRLQPGIHQRHVGQAFARSRSSWCACSSNVLIPTARGWQGAARADHRAARSRGPVERGPHPAACSRFDRSHAAYELFPTRMPMARRSRRSCSSSRRGFCRTFRRQCRCTRSSSTRRASKACICVRDRSLAAGCGGRIARRTIAPRCSVSSKRKPSRTRSSCRREQKAAFSCGDRPRRVMR